MSPNTKPSRRIVALLGTITLACTASLGGIATPSQAVPMQLKPRIPVVEVTVDSTHITAPKRLPQGFTTFHTTSTHPGTDSLAVVRLHHGVTYAQIFGYLRDGNLAAVFRHVAGKGGIAHGGPHNGRSWTTHLHPGRHLFVDDEANLFAKLKVTFKRNHAPRPHTDGTNSFDDGKFTLPRRFHDGSWRLANEDTIQHEIALVRIHGDHTKAEVKRVLAAGTHPAWLEPQATVNLVGPNRNAWVRLRDLGGFYVFLDYMPMFQGVADGPIARFRHIREQDPLLRLRSGVSLTPSSSLLGHTGEQTRHKIVVRLMHASVQEVSEDHELCQSARSRHNADKRLRGWEPRSMRRPRAQSESLR